MQTTELTLLTRSRHVTQLRKALVEKGFVYLGAYYGSGKTVLVRQLLAQENAPYAYFYCASADFDPALPGIPAGCGLVVVENVEALTEAADRNTLMRRLWELSPETRVLLTGRSRLPSWLKADYTTGRLTRLGQDFVAITEEEAARYVRQRGLQVTQGLMNFIRQQNYGWAMALPLGLNYFTTSDLPPEKLLKQMWRDVYDCFDQALFDTYDAEMQSFLLHLGSFEQVTPAMAAAVTGMDTASATLLRLLDLGSYMIPDDEGGYVVQPFMHAYLMDVQRRKCSSEFIAEQFDRAASFWRGQGKLQRALEYYHRAGNTDQILILLREESRKKASAACFAELKGYYDLLPNETIQAYPELMSGMCMICSLRCQVEESEKWYQALEAYVNTQPKNAPETVQARRELYYLRVALPHRGSRGVAALLVDGARLMMRGELNARSMSVAGSSPSLLNGGKDFCCWLGHAEALYRSIRRPVEMALGKSGVGLGNIALGEALLETDLEAHYDRAMELLTAGIAEAEAGGELEMRYAGIGVLCRLFVAQGNLDRAQKILDSFQKQLDRRENTRLWSNLRAQQVRLALLAGDIGIAQQWLRVEAPDETDSFIILDRYGYMTKLRLYLAENRMTEFSYLVNRMLQYYRAYQRPYGQAECLLLMAIARYRQHKNNWCSALKEAMAICERYQLVRLVADEGEAALMLTKYLQPDTPYRTAVLEAVCTQAQRYPAYLASQQMERQALTEMEQEVFRLMAVGKKNEEIAAVLHITVRTVKFHTGNLYRKLNVSGRMEAIRRATELGIY